MASLTSRVNSFYFSKEDDNVEETKKLEQQEADAAELASTSAELNNDSQKASDVIDTGQCIQEVYSKNEEQLQENPKEITQSTVVATERELSYLIGKLHGLRVNVKSSKFINVGFEAAAVAPVQATEIQQQGISDTIKVVNTEIVTLLENIVNKFIPFIKQKIETLKSKESTIGSLLSSKCSNVSRESSENEYDAAVRKIGYLVLAYDSVLDMNDFVKYATREFNFNETDVVSNVNYKDSTPDEIKADNSNNLYKPFNISSGTLFEANILKALGKEVGVLAGIKEDTTVVLDDVTVNTQLSTLVTDELKQKFNTAFKNYVTSIDCSTVSTIFSSHRISSIASTNIAKVEEYVNSLMRLVTSSKAILDEITISGDTARIDVANTHFLSLCKSVQHSIDAVQAFMNIPDAFVTFYSIIK